MSIKKNIVAIIPARGGSKGVKDKNVRLLAGVPLIYHSILFARSSNLFQDIIVSTDGEKIIDVCEQINCNIIRRPETISKDNSLVIEAIRYTLKELNKQNKYYDAVVLLEPTSPIREIEDLIMAIDAVTLNNYKSAATLTKVDPPPTRLWKLKGNQIMPLFKNKSPFLPRQEHENAYKLTGQIYAFTPEFIENSKTGVLDENFFPIINDSALSVDIDEEIDFIIAEKLLEINEKLKRSSKLRR